MAISLSRYFNATSGIGAASNITNRSYGGLVITLNPLCPSGKVISFTNAAAVGLYFGTSSPEYARAVFYFSWISPTITTPQQLSFYFWNNNVATGSLIFGAQGPYTLANFTAVSSGQLSLTLGGFTNTLTGINLSAAGSLSAVASAIQTAIRAYSAGGTAWTGATVTYSATGTGSFNLTSGATGTDVIAVIPVTPNDVANLLGWESASTVLSNGTSAQTVTQVLTSLVSSSNNFGSFCFGPVSGITLQNLLDAANFNNTISPNNQFLFSMRTTAANAATYQAALAGIGGCTMTLAPLTTEFPEMVPMIELAATDYTQRNSTLNYMYKVFNLTPSVLTDVDANTYDALGINYYGQSQTAGQYINFYQRGLMFGLPVNPPLQNIYANEIWLKDTIGSLCMNLQLSVNQIPASNTGIAQLTAITQSAITQALFNGVIEPGKTLTIVQQLYITQVTGDSRAWRQVQNTGWWLAWVITPYTDVAGKTEYKATYTLVYSKNDVVNYITGADILI